MNATALGIEAGKGGAIARPPKHEPITVTVPAQRTSKPFRGYLMSAAIDIGTSSSCYAFSYKSHPDDIKMNKNWSGQDSYQSYKTPTAVLTAEGPGGEFVAFGYEAERKYREIICEGKATEYNLYTDYKMILYREKALHKKQTLVTSKIGTKRSLMDVYVMTLDYLVKHMKEEIDKTGASVVYPSEVRWVLCVPATWNDKAKDFLRHAAYKAKMITDVQSSQLLILLEATAAALYCQDPKARFSAKQLYPSLMEVPVGTKYLVIDAGAGTVDFTAQEVQKDNQVKELSIANGGDWGGRHVDERFKKLLRDILGDKFVTDFIKQFPLLWYDLEMTFEQAKSCADPDGKPINVQLPVMMDRSMTKSEKNLTEIINGNTTRFGVKENNGYLVIDPTAVKRLFEPTIKEIRSHAEKMLELNALKGLEYVYLVGGFSSCKLLNHEMTSKFRDFTIVNPTDARAAVVRGAVKYGHNPNIVIRIAKKTYGVSTYSAFDTAKHPADKKQSLGANALCKDLFVPFVQKEEELEPGTHGEMIAVPVVAEATSVVVEFYCLDRKTSPNEVLFIDSPGVEPNGQVRVPMTDTKGGLKREVKLHFTFNDEIRVVAFEKDTLDKVKVNLTFDYDTRK